MSGLLTEAAQNRLIQSHVSLVQPIAASFRGRKNIPFEELCAQGVVGLVEAARIYIPEKSDFPQWASIKIRSSISHFVDGWGELIPLDATNGEEDRLIYEWQNGFFALYENWSTPPKSPEELLMRYDEISAKGSALAAAFIGLSKRERQMIQAYFMDEPRVSLPQIARDHRVSYKKTTDTIYRALGKMRDVVSAIRQRETAVAA